MNRFITFLICSLLGLSTALAGGNYTMNVGDELLLSFTPASGARTETMVWTISAPSSLEFVGSPHYKSYARVKAIQPFSSTIVVQCRYERTVYNGTFPYSKTEAEDFYITINPSDPTGIYIPSSLSLVVGERHTITPTIEPSGAKTNVFWSTSDSGIALVTSSGTVIANSPGTAYITARTDNGYSSQCRVTVSKPTLTLSASAASGLYPKGKKVALKASPSVASIYYTLDGSTPSSSSTLYTDSIEIDGETQLKAVAKNSGYNDSNMLERSYNTTSLSVIETHPNTEEEIWRDKLIPAVVFNKNVCKGNLYDEIAFIDQENRPVSGKIVINQNQLIFISDALLPAGKYQFKIPQDALESIGGEPNFTSTLEVNLKGTSKVVKAICHNQSSFVLKDDGSLWSAGFNYNNSVLGYESDGEVKTLTKVLDNIKNISINTPSMALTNNGEVYQWGFGYGDEDGQSKVYPKLILTDVISICQGYKVSYAIKSDHSLWAWGNNQDGQLGNGSRENVDIPVKIMDNVSEVRADCHTLVIKDDGSLWGWGLNKYGQLGIGSTDTIINPTKIMDEIKDVSIVGNCSYILDKNGQLYACGNGQIGNGENENCLTPVKVLDEVKYIPQQVDASRFYAIKNDGTLWGWGINYGSLGDGSQTNRNKPVKILSNIVFISVGDSHTYAIKDDKTLWGWGGWKGDWLVGVGDGTVYSRSTPIQILENINYVSTWSGSVMAISTEGELYTWGANGCGECAIGEFGTIRSPIKICSNSAKINPESVVLADLSVCVENTALAIPKVQPINSDYKQIEWSTGNESIATVDEYGIVTGISSGETSLIATITDFSGNTLTASCTITVVAPTVASIFLDKTEATIKTSQTLQLTATIAPEDAADKTITWASSDSNVATVDATGLVTAISVGNADITATANGGTGLYATCKITVEPILIESLSISPESFSGAEGESFIINVTISPENATNKILRFSSSDVGVATVDNYGKVIIDKEGTATIKVETTDGSNLSSECVVTSLAAGIDKIFNDGNCSCDVYNVNGLLLIKDADIEKLHRLPDGIYIIRQGNDVTKLYLKEE